MITSANSLKMVVISDLHLGNPFSKYRNEILRFMRWAASENYDICINGDGLEIAQASFTQLAEEMPEVLRTLGELNKLGTKVYYVVGNHDIALEHFLEDFGNLKVCPFLNLTSGAKRIRIEHGHLYDPFFVSFPVLYEFLTRLAGLFLAIHPNLYKLWILFEKLLTVFRSQDSGIKGEPVEFKEAAIEISRRGFDAVVFGHTHYPGKVDLQDGKFYYNSGSWLLTRDYIVIDQGRMELKNY